MERDCRLGLSEVDSRYELVARLGAGGMAQVYLGVQRGFEAYDRWVVIKRVRRKPSERAGAPTFLNEARLVASLNHPQIVKIFDVCRMGSDVCLVMEYIRGENLSFVRRFCEAQGLTVPLPVVCRLMIQAAEALHHAHCAKASDGTPLHLVHRDIGPQNLLVSATGYLKVIDFGIAKSAITQNELTAPGVIKGKLPYIAPELFQNKTLDGRVDLYALGLVLYELLTLKQGFTYAPATPFASVIYRVTTEELPVVSQLARHVNAHMDSIVAKATHKDREQRYATGLEFAQDLAHYGEQFAGRVATTAEVAAWFRETLGRRMAERVAFERAAIRRPRAAVHAADHLPQFVTDTAPLVSPSPELPPSETHDASPRRPSWRAHHPRKWFRRRYALGALAAAGAVLALVPIASRTFTRELRGEEDTDAAAVDPNLLVRSIPSGATVWLNGEIVGTSTPEGLRLKIPVEVKSALRVSHQGYRDYRVLLRGPDFGQRLIVARLRRDAPDADNATPTHPKATGPTRTGRGKRRYVAPGRNRSPRSHRAPAKRSREIPPASRPGTAGAKGSTSRQVPGSRP